MQIFAHRGYHADVPENTLEAFDRALNLGVDGIETDVRMCADGTAILFHDRLAPNGRAVFDLTRAELSSLVGYEVPTLDSTLERYGAALWNLEIKDPSVLHATVAAVSRYAATTRFLITSFWHPVIERISGLVPVDCGLLNAHCPLTSVLAVKGRPLRPNLNTLVWYFETIDDHHIQETSTSGIRNIVYGAVTRSEHERLFSLGVDGVITDYPEHLLGRPTAG